MGIHQSSSHRGRGDVVISPHTPLHAQHPPHSFSFSGTGSKKRHVQCCRSFFCSNHQQPTLELELCQGLYSVVILLLMCVTCGLGWIVFGVSDFLKDREEAYHSHGAFIGRAVVRFLFIPWVVILFVYLCVFAVIRRKENLAASSSEPNGLTGRQIRLFLRLYNILDVLASILIVVAVASTSGLHVFATDAMERSCPSPTLTSLFLACLGSIRFRPVVILLIFLVPLWRILVQVIIGSATGWTAWSDWMPGRMVLWSFLLFLGTVAAMFPAKYYEILLRRFFGWRRRLSEATQAVTFEIEKTEKLLQNVVPASFVDALKEKAGELFSSSNVQNPCIPNLGFVQHFTDDSLVIVQTDFVGFTSFSSSRSSRDLIAILNAFFLRSDEMLMQFSLEKVKTAGDAIIAVDLWAKSRIDKALTLCGGEREELLSFSELLCLLFGLGIQSATKEVCRELGIDLKMRVGVVRGTGVVGVIGGGTSITFDVFGSLVQKVDKLEASCVPGGVHVGTVEESWNLPVRLRQLVDVIGSGEGGLMLLGHSDEKFSLDVLGIEELRDFVHPTPTFVDLCQGRDDSQAPQCERNQGSSVKTLKQREDRRYEVHPVFCVFRSMVDNLAFLKHPSKDLRVMTMWQSILATVTYLAFSGILLVSDPQYYATPTFLIGCVVAAVSMVATTLLVASFSFVKREKVVAGWLVVVSFVNGSLLASVTLFSILFEPAISLDGIGNRNYTLVVAIYLHFFFLLIPWILKTFLVVFSTVAFLIVRNVLNFSLQSFVYTVMMLFVQVLKFYQIHRLILNNFGIGEKTREQWHTAQKRNSSNDLLLESFLPRFVIDRLKTWDEESDEDSSSDIRSTTSTLASRMSLFVTSAAVERLFPRISDVVRDGCSCFVKIHTVGFSDASPTEIVRLLMLLYREFDLVLAEAPSCSKIKSLNTTYLFIARSDIEPKETRGSDVRIQVADSLLRMRDRFFELIERVMPPGCCAYFRAGAHAGSFHQGIVGSTKYLLDVFGDVVNVSARLSQQKDFESSVAAIECSSTFIGTDSVEDVDLRHQFVFGESRSLSLKGKGDMLAWRLLNRKST